MRIFCTISLILIVSLISFQEAYIYLGFKVSQDFIAANFCEEKDIEDSECRGSCSLLKMVKSTNEKPTDNAPVPNIEPIKINLFLENTVFFFPAPATSFAKPLSRSCLKNSEYLPSILRPPIV